MTEILPNPTFPRSRAGLWPEGGYLSQRAQNPWFIYPFRSMGWTDVRFDPSASAGSPETAKKKDLFK